VTERGRYLAVVPAYNEAATLQGVVRSIRRNAPEFDIVVIDDGSTDETAALARAEGIRTVRLPFNLGIGGAVQTGFKYASQHRYDYLVQVDADGQHDPHEIRKLIEVMRDDPGLDVVCGSRFIEDFKYPAPISRRTGIHLFAFVLSRIVGDRVTDPTSGFRLYNRRAIDLFSRDYPHDYPEVEAVLMLHFHRLRMREYPVRMYRRGGGVSSISSGKSIHYMLKVLLAIFIGLLRSRPIAEPGDEAPVSAVPGV
jgi:glycosyltransferase involved in cell wall biosynthesis